MNRKNAMIAVAFALGALAASGVWRLATPPAAAAQAMNPLVAERLNNLDKRLAVLENQATKSAQASNQTTGPLHSGGASGVTTGQLGSAQINQLVQLQNEVDGLKTQLTKLQTQFANHYHNYTVTSDPGSAHGVETILNCQGYGKPCTSASSLGEVTVLVPPNVTPTAQTNTVKTSGPLQPSN